MHERMNNKNIFVIKIALIVICVLIPFISMGYDAITGKRIQGTQIGTFLSHPKSGDIYDLGELTDQTTVRQSFLAEMDSLYSITLWGATWGRDNNIGTIYVRIMDDAGQCLMQWEVDVASMQNDAEITFALPNLLPVEKGSCYYVEIVDQGSVAGQSATFFAIAEDWNPYGSLEMNGQEMPGDLFMRIEGQSDMKSYAKVKYTLQFLVFGILAWIIFTTIKSGERKR